MARFIPPSKNVSDVLAIYTLTLEKQVVPLALGKLSNMPRNTGSMQERHKPETPTSSAPAQLTFPHSPCAETATQANIHKKSGTHQPWLYVSRISKPSGEADYKAPTKLCQPQPPGHSKRDSGATKLGLFEIRPRPPPRSVAGEALPLSPRGSGRAASSRQHGPPPLQFGPGPRAMPAGTEGSAVGARPRRSAEPPHRDFASPPAAEASGAPAARSGRRPWPSRCREPRRRSPHPAPLGPGEPHCCHRHRLGQAHRRPPGAGQPGGAEARSAGGGLPQAAVWPHLLRDGWVAAAAAAPRVAGAERGRRRLGLHVPVEERGPLRAAAAAQRRHLGSKRRGEGGGSRVPAAGTPPAATRSGRGGARIPASSQRLAPPARHARPVTSPRIAAATTAHELPGVTGKHPDVTARPPVSLGTRTWALAPPPRRGPTPSPQRPLAAAKGSRGRRRDWGGSFRPAARTGCGWWRARGDSRRLGLCGEVWAQVPGARRRCPTAASACGSSSAAASDMASLRVEWKWN